jgi:hypothetical protein
MSIQRIESSMLDGSASGLSGFRNRIINGDMRIDQRNNGASVALSAGAANFVTDRWSFFVSQSSRLSSQQNAGSVTPPPGFTNYLGATSLSAHAVGSAEIFNLNHKIEGFNIADLGWGTANAQPVTLSFWVRSSLTGTFGGSLICGAGSYPFTYSVNAANTWTNVTIAVPANTNHSPSSTTNGQGLYVSFGLGVGSTQSGAAGSWTGTQFYSATGATSVVGTNGATFYITGVQLEAGSVATPFERRPFGMELALCQRYYEKSYSISVVPGTATEEGSFGMPTGNISGPIFNLATIAFKVEKRAAPSISYFDLVGNASRVSTFSFATADRTDNVNNQFIPSPSTSQCRVLYVTSNNGQVAQWVASIEL